ncbi:phage portal protein [Limibacter armeniacum]|uniref:phage portal protein n=1 Tax=Limibacter armeniacum TaxID=466084 RepID=UPI002FE504FC
MRRSQSYKEVLHFKLPVSFEGLQGLSPNICKQGSDAIYHALNHVKNAFRNGLKRPSVLMVQDKLNQRKGEGTSTSFETKVRNLDKDEWSALVLQSGLDVKEIGSTLKDAEAVAIINALVDEIARAFNIPSSLLKSINRSSYKSLEEHTQEFITFSLLPIVVMLEAELERKAASYEEIGTLDYVFNMDDLNRGNISARMQKYETMFHTAAISPDEIRREENMQPKGEPWSDDYYMRRDVAPVKQLNDLVNSQIQEAISKNKNSNTETNED